MMKELPDLSPRALDLSTSRIRSVRDLARRTAARALLLLALAAPASAHERWVDHALLRDFDRSLFREFGLVHAALVLALVGLLVVLGSLGRSGRLPRFAGFAHLEDAGPLLARLGLGVSLLALLFGGFFVAPDLILDASPGARVLGAATGLVAVLLVLGLQTRRAAVAFLIVFAGAVVVRPFLAFDAAAIQPSHVLVYFELLAIGAYLAMRGPGPLALDAGGVADPSPSAARLLQRLLGLNILAHGLMKIVSPELPMGVVQNYTEQIYDPVRALVPISEEGFVLAASAVEIFLGSSLLLGVLPLLSMLVVLFTFLMTTWVFRGDLVGHLPRIGAMLALILAESRHLDHRADIVRSLFRRGPARGLRPVRVPVLLFALVLGGASLALPGEPAIAELPAEGPAEARGHALELGRAARGEGEAGRLAFELAPLPPGIRVGEIFPLRLQILDSNTGLPWRGPKLPRVEVTMPRHGHGMDTLPELARTPDGGYVLEGCQFNMHGLWQIELEVDGVDRARFELRFAPAPGAP